MSSILKALRKLEEDKTALGEGRIDIARDILKRRYKQPPERGNRLPVALITGFAIILFGMVFWIYWPEEKVSQSAVNQRETNQTSRPIPAAEPSPSLQNPTLIEQPKIAEVPVTHHEKPPKARKSQASVTHPVLAPRREADTSAVKTIEKTPPIELPDFIVSQILYDPQPEGRLAIVNDLPVMEETDIEGAKVVEILTDKVRFTYHGVEFVKTVTNHEE